MAVYGNTGFRPERRVILGFIVEVLALAGLVYFRDNAGLEFLWIALVAASLYPIMLGARNRRRNLIIYGALVVAGGLVRMGLESARYGRIDEHAIMVKAIVLDTGRYPAKVRGGARWVEYRYDVNGVTYTAREYAPPCAPGDTLLIRYAESDPSVSLPVAE